MSILLLTPLFPPDVSESASYAKRLATTLGENGASLTVLHYGQYPESVPGVVFVSIKKDTNTLLRLLRFSYALWQHRHASTVLILNGPSVEAPVVLIKRFLSGILLYVKNDTKAAQSTTDWHTVLRDTCSRLAAHTITPAQTLLHPPLHHPLDSTTTEKYHQYQQDWTAHVMTLLALCQK